MILALWVAVLVLAVASTLLFGALIEMFEQLKQLRRVFGFEDGTNAVDIPDAAGMRPSEAGLPAVLDDLDRSALILFVSDICASCRGLAEGLRGGTFHNDLWVVVVHVSSRAEAFVEEFALYGDRVINDVDQSIVSALGVTMTPVALIVSEGRIDRAQTVPSLHQLEVALQGIARIDQTRGSLSH